MHESRKLQIKLPADKNATLRCIQAKKRSTNQRLAYRRSRRPPCVARLRRLDRCGATISMPSLRNSPNGVQLKKSSGARPCPRNSLSIIMLGEDAIRVVIPLISAATDNGMLQEWAENCSENFESVQLILQSVFVSEAIEA